MIGLLLTAPRPDLRRFPCVLWGHSVDQTKYLATRDFIDSGQHVTAQKSLANEVMGRRLILREGSSTRALEEFSECIFSVISCKWIRHSRLKLGRRQGFVQPSHVQACQELGGCDVTDSQLHACEVIILI